jgi:PAS domain S-box-containing protein
MPGVPDLSALPLSLTLDSESEEILRLTRLAAKIFQVPVSYTALLGPNLHVVKRIGEGMEFCRRLRETWPLSPATAWPILWPDPTEPGYEDIAGDGLGFACSAPLFSSDGMTFGLLVIADTRPRPDFTVHERDIFADLASVFAQKMELRGIASEAVEAELAMREAEARFRNIANSAPVLIIYSDAEARCSFVNDTWLQFTGRRFDEETGDGFAETFHPSYRETVLGSFHDAFAARVPVSLEFPMLRYDGEHRWMRTSGKPRFLPDGTFVGYIGCFVDITSERTAVLKAEKYKAAAETLAEAGGITWELLEPAGDPRHLIEPSRTALSKAIATRTRTAAGPWTYTPLLVEDALVGITATKR